MSRITWIKLMVLFSILVLSGCSVGVQSQVETTGVPGDQPTATPVPPTTPDASFNCADVSEIPAVECQALVTFFEVTGGPNWIDSSGWLETTTPCSWLGVTCMGGHVDTLGLFFNDLQGQLPAAIADLSQLRVLDLHNNLISGSIPPEFGHLTSLEYLDISVNLLEGAIPAEIGGLRALQTLNLAYNELSGPIPSEIGQMAGLRNLELSRNQLTGAIPAALSDLVVLESIRLSDNLLDGTIPFSLGQLTSLTEIDLSFNQLSGSAPSALFDSPIHRFWGNQLDGTIFAGEEGQQVNYLGAAFSFDKATADSVWPDLVPARKAEEGPGIMWAPPEHIVFTLVGDAEPQDHAPMGLYIPSEAQIHIYSTAGLNEEVQPIVDDLRLLLAEEPDLTAFETIAPEMDVSDPGLAMLPPSNAAQMFRAQAEFISFAEGRGVRYLTQLSQGLVPVNNGDLFYTFQGLTQDGATYVAAYFPVALPELPDSQQIEEADFAAIMEDWPGYLTQTTALLDEQSATAFSPNLTVLDALINSLSVSGTKPIPAINAIWPNEGESVDNQPVLQWAAVPGAVRYELVVVDDDAFPPLVAFNQFTTDTVMPVNPPLDPGSYTWTVRALADDDTVLAELNHAFLVKDAVNLLYPPIEEMVDPQPTLQWASFPGAENYHLMLLDDGAYPPQVIIDETVAEPMLLVDQPLAPGHYSWTVLAQDANGVIVAELTGTFTVKE